MVSYDSEDFKRPEELNNLQSSYYNKWLQNHLDSQDSQKSQNVNVLALVKGIERFVFIYDDERRTETLRTLGRFATNPELNFTWHDAAVLSQKIRQIKP